MLPCTSCSLNLSSGDPASSDYLGTFHDFKLSSHDQSIVANIRLVYEPNGGVGRCTRRQGIIGTIYKLNTQILAIATFDTQMWPIAKVFFG